MKFDCIMHITEYNRKISHIYGLEGNIYKMGIPPKLIYIFNNQNPICLFLVAELTD